MPIQTLRAAAAAAAPRRHAPPSPPTSPVRSSGVHLESQRLARSARGGCDWMRFEQEPATVRAAPFPSPFVSPFPLSLLRWLFPFVFPSIRLQSQRSSGSGEQQQQRRWSSAALQRWHCSHRGALQHCRQPRVTGRVAAPRPFFPFPFGLLGCASADWSVAGPKDGTRSAISDQATKRGTKRQRSTRANEQKEWAITRKQNKNKQRDVDQRKERRV